MSRRQPDPLPEVRIGNCAGCSTFPTTIYLITPGLHRYRCAPCYEKETGLWPHRAPSKADYERLQRT